MTKKQKIIITFSVITIFLTTLSGILWTFKNKKTKPNILIISICSLRKAFLPGYSSEEFTNNYPNIKKFSENSFLFKNAFTEVSWSNVSGFLYGSITEDFVEKNGYIALGAPWNQDGLIRHTTKEQRETKKPRPANYYARIPDEYGEVSTDIELIQHSIERLKAKILKNQNDPFIVEAHIKFAHAPYLFDDLNPKNPNNNREKYSQLVNDKQYARLKQLAQKNIDEASKSGDVVWKLLFYKIDPDVTIVGPNNPKDLYKWTQSSTYKDDIQLLISTYKSKIKKLDDLLGNILNLFGDQHLQQNTIVIFTGDHGETFMDHGQLMHGETAFDEVITFPLMIKFPNQKYPQAIDKQFFQGSITSIVQSIMEGKLTEENFQDFVQKNVHDDVIASRDCTGKVRSIRYQNKWKLIANFSNDQKDLYDLVNDPLEQKNVFSENPQIAADLEDLLLETAPPNLNVMHHTCLPVF